jgi:hypothetical protein
MRHHRQRFWLLERGPGAEFADPFAPRLPCRPLPSPSAPPQGVRLGSEEARDLIPRLLLLLSFDDVDGAAKSLLPPSKPPAIRTDMITRASLVPHLHVRSGPAPECTHGPRARRTLTCAPRAAATAPRTSRGGGGGVTEGGGGGRRAQLGVVHVDTPGDRVFLRLAAFLRGRHGWRRSMVEGSTRGGARWADP